jgi:hypothetical protein
MAAAVPSSTVMAAAAAATASGEPALLHAPDATAISSSPNAFGHAGVLDTHSQPMQTGSDDGGYTWDPAAVQSWCSATAPPLCGETDISQCVTLLVTLRCDSRQVPSVRERFTNLLAESIMVKCGGKEITCPRHRAANMKCKYIIPLAGRQSLYLDLHSFVHTSH